MYFAFFKFAKNAKVLFEKMKVMLQHNMGVQMLPGFVGPWDGLTTAGIVGARSIDLKEITNQVF